MCPTREWSVSRKQVHSLEFQVLYFKNLDFLVVLETLDMKPGVWYLEHKTWTVNFIFCEIDEENEKFGIFSKKEVFFGKQYWTNRKISEIVEISSKKEGKDFYSSKILYLYASIRKSSSLPGSVRVRQWIIFSCSSDTRKEIARSTFCLNWCVQLLLLYSAQFPE